MNECVREVGGAPVCIMLLQLLYHNQYMISSRLEHFPCFDAFELWSEIDANITLARFTQWTRGLNFQVIL